MPRRVHQRDKDPGEPGAMKIQLTALFGLAGYLVWTTSLAGITANLVAAVAP
jgi:hypothetical protein